MSFISTWWWWWWWSTAKRIERCKIKRSDSEKDNQANSWLSEIIYQKAEKTQRVARFFSVVETLAAVTFHGERVLINWFDYFLHCLNKTCVVTQQAQTKRFTDNSSAITLINFKRQSIALGVVMNFRLNSGLSWKWWMLCWFEFLNLPILT